MSIKRKFKVGDTIYDVVYPTEVYYIYDIGNNCYRVKGISDFGEIDYIDILFDEETQYERYELISN